MKRMAVLILACVGAVPLLHALTETVDGITWSYDLRDYDYDMEGNLVHVGYQFAAICAPTEGNAAIPTSTTGEVTIPKEIQGYKVRHIGNFAFTDCTNISALTVPAGVTYIGINAFLGATRLRDITFLGDVPTDFSAGDFPEGAKVFFPKRYAANWEKALAGSPIRGGWLESRATPTIEADFPVTNSERGEFSISYTVTSAHGNATVGVYPIAFREGKRTVENLVIPRSVSGCGDVASGVEQTLTWTWQMDFPSEDITRVRLELLVRDGAVLPKETVEIPGVDGGQYPDCTVTRNGLSESQALNALLWYLAKKDDTRLTISGNAILIDGKKVYEDGDFGFDDTLLLNYLYGKEGYALITDSMLLDYIEQVLGTTSSRSGLGQIAIKQQ